GFSHYGFANNTLVSWNQHWQQSNGITNGYPRITFTGFALNANANAPRHRDQDVWQLRDDFTYSFDARGRHDMRIGAEYVRNFEDRLNCAQCGGTLGAPRRHDMGIGAEYVRHFEDSLNCAQCGGTIDARNTVNGLNRPTVDQLN